VITKCQQELQQQQQGQEQRWYFVAIGVPFPGPKSHNAPGLSKTGTTSVTRTHALRHQPRRSALKFNRQIIRLLDTAAPKTLRTRMRHFSIVSRHFCTKIVVRDTSASDQRKVGTLWTQDNSVKTAPPVIRLSVGAEVSWSEMSCGRSVRLPIIPQQWRSHARVGTAAM